jgi:hypothetical protein
MDLYHLLWIPVTAAVGFAAAFLLADLLVLPVDLYYFLYFVSVLGFAAYYAARTRLEVVRWATRGLARAIVLGFVVGVVLARGVLAQPETPALAGAAFWWALLWRGLVYGLVDGILLFALPWTITWRALDAEQGGVARKIGAGAVAWVAVLVVTTAYHLGYSDFRSSRSFSRTSAVRSARSRHWRRRTLSLRRSRTCSCMWLL